MLRHRVAEMMHEMQIAGASMRLLHAFAHRPDVDSFALQGLMLAGPS